MGDPRIGEVLTETYRIERLLGRGSMGVVYEASHLRVPRRFAVKLLIHDVASHRTAVERFRREAEVTGRIGHPNIVEVIDFNTTDDGQPYLVMELLEGEDLGLRLERVGRLPPREVWPILSQAGSALQAAHDCGVVHRDLKPRNLFLCRRPDGEKLKVVDFGISKILGVPSSLTQSAGVFGSPHYMSPEQADGQHDRVDQRTDIYAMGVLLYQMLSGRLPFGTGAPLAVLFKIVNSDPPRLDEVCPDVPRPVAAAVHGALARDREQRTASMAALVDGFREALAAPALFVPVDTAAAARRGKGAPPLVWIAAIGVTLLAVVAIVATLLLAREPPPAPVVEPGRAAVDAASTAAADVRLAVVAPDSGELPTDTRLAVRQPPPPDAAAALPPQHRARRRLRPARRPRRPPPAPRSMELALLRVVTVHNGRSLWAEVRLDGQLIGRTPVYNSAVLAGAHHLEVSRAGFKTIRRRVVFKEGEEQRLMFQLEADGAR